MEHHEKILLAHNEYGENNDCAVAAIAYATGESYEKVHAELEKLGRKHGDGAYVHTIMKAIENLGYEIEGTFEPSQLEVALGFTKLGLFMNHAANNPARYLVVTPNHVLAVNGEHALDTGGTSMEAPVFMAIKLAKPVAEAA